MLTLVNLYTYGVWTRRSSAGQACVLQEWCRNTNRITLVWRREHRHSAGMATNTEGNAETWIISVPSTKQTLVCLVLSRTSSRDITSDFGTVINIGISKATPWHRCDGIVSRIMLPTDCSLWFEVYLRKLITSVITKSNTDPTSLSGCYDRQHRTAFMQYMAPFVHQILKQLLHFHVHFVLT